VRAVSEITNHTLAYDTLIGLRQRMKELAPNLVYCNENVRMRAIRPPVAEGQAAQPAVNAALRLSVKLNELLDYYQTDVISRSSPTMAKCVVALRKELEKRAEDQRLSAN